MTVPSLLSQCIQKYPELVIKLDPVTFRSVHNQRWEDAKMKASTKQKLNEEYLKSGRCQIIKFTKYLEDKFHLHKLMGIDCDNYGDFYVLKKSCPAALIATSPDLLSSTNSG
jgi:hypothetical protein